MQIGTHFVATRKIKLLVVQNHWQKFTSPISNRAGYQRRDHARDPPAADFRQVRACQSGCVCGGSAGEGSQRTAPAHPAHTPTAATDCAGCVPCAGQRVCPRGVFARSSRLVFITNLTPLTTQLNVPTKYSPKLCCVLWILTVNNLPLLDPQ